MYHLVCYLFLLVYLSFHLLLFDKFSFLYFLTLLKVNFFYLLAVPGLCCGAQALLCSAQAFSSCREWGPLSSLVCRLLIAVAPLAAERGLWVPGFRNCGSQALEHRFRSCVSWALSLHGMWGLSGSRIKPVSLQLADTLFTLGSPGRELY